MAGGTSACFAGLGRGEDRKRATRAGSEQECSSTHAAPPAHPKRCLLENRWSGAGAGRRLMPVWPGVSCTGLVLRAGELS
jgi:hypothetical protein